MPPLELETEEAKFMLNMAGWEHFAIDCSCKGKDGSYHGSHYKNITPCFERQFDAYYSIRMNKSEHTFLMGEFLFEGELREHDKDSPLVIVCNDCGREFPFTCLSYILLKGKMTQEFNRRLSEKQ